MNLKLKNISFLIASILLISGCTKEKRTINKKAVVITVQRTKKRSTISVAAPEETSSPWITVFIHGTRLVPRIFARASFHCDSGFHTASEIKNRLLHGRIGYTLNRTAPQQFPIDNYYYYCWSGDLSFESREKAAHILYGHLTRVIKEYKEKNGQTPLLRVIGHSHGCNVALNLAREKTTTDPLSIDQLILLAGPVQAAYIPLIKDDMFKKIYSLYSRADSIQIIDPQGVYKYTKKNGFISSLFSRRRFTPQSNIKQVKIKLNGRAPGHVEFIYPHFIRLIPQIIHTMDEWEDLNTPNNNIEYLLKITTRKH